MTPADIQRLIDYFVKQNGGNLSIEIASVAALFSLVSILIAFFSSYRQYSHSIYSYLADVWNDLLNTAMTNPEFMDITKTSIYYDSMSYEQSLRYDIYCYKCWGHVEDIIAKKFYKDPQFSPVIRWICGYHLAWLNRNPTFFTLPKFWEVVEEYKNKPNINYASHVIPTKQNEIDWDTVAEDYNRYILSPFAPEMVVIDNGKRRNLLLNYLAEIPDSDIRKMDVADFGCGPGNLIEFLAGRLDKLTGIDSSQTALNIAQRKAKQNAMVFEEIHADMRQLPKNLHFDLIVAVNSILPKKRSEVVTILDGMRLALKRGGRIVTILPSFDTTEYLISLWEEYYLKELSHPEHAKRIVDSFSERKKVNRQELSYADDGRNAQCYHTPASIEAEFKEAKLHIIKMEKVYYPWLLTRRFEYGFFPDASEEIWDWFVVAERSDTPEVNRGR